MLVTAFSTLGGSAAIAATASGATDAATGPAAEPVDRNRTLTRETAVLPGTIFDIAAGATLTIEGDVLCPATLVFRGAGKVDLSRSRVVAARPEWFGAVADDPAVDCEPALSACLAAHPAMQLGLGDYHLGRTWTIDRSDRRIWGVGRMKGGRGTRLLLAGGEGAVVLVGTERAPPSINEYVSGIDMRWIELGRSAAPRASPDPLATPTGLRVRNVLSCVFEGLRATEHALGFSLRGAVRTFVRDCEAFRSLPGSIEARDIFVGFDMDSRGSAIATGANASLFLIDCVARTGNRPRLAVSVGCRMTGLLSDTFLTRFETTQLATGIAIDGLAETLSPAGRRVGHFDLHIDHPVLDQCLETGIAVARLSDHAMVDIAAPYVALGPQGLAAIAVGSTGGNVQVTGGQLIGSVGPGDSGTGTGLMLNDVTGVAFDGVKLLGFARPVVASNATSFELVIAVNHRGAATGHPAIDLSRCRGGYLRPRILGSTGAFTSGVALDAASQSVSIEATGIDAATVGDLPVTVGGKLFGDRGLSGSIVVTGAVQG